MISTVRRFRDFGIWLLLGVAVPLVLLFSSYDSLCASYYLMLEEAAAKGWMIWAFNPALLILYMPCLVFVFWMVFFGVDYYGVDKK